MATKQLGAQPTTSGQLQTVSTIGAADMGRWWHPGTYISGYWYHAHNQMTNSGGNQVGNNTLRFMPFVVWDSLTISTLAWLCSTAGDSGGFLKVGFYSHDETNGVPDALLLDAGSFSVGTGNAGTVPFTLNVTMLLPLAQNFTFPKPGIYWLAAVLKNSPTTPPTANCAANVPPWNMPYSTASSFTAQSPQGFARFSYTDANLPNPAGVTPAGSSTWTNIIPRILMKAV